jgi:hypothetical protein
MAFVRQKHKSDCGIAALAMLCDVTYEMAENAITWGRRGWQGGTTTKQLREGGEVLGYHTLSTPQRRLKVVREPIKWFDMPPPSISDWWYIIPDNSLVKVGSEHEGWHWVVWRKNKIYDPARGVFHPAKHGAKPLSYMEFIKGEDNV